MYRVHHFSSSQQAAYEASLDEGSICEGDILVIAAEDVVGLASTDPIASTVAHGALKNFPSMAREMLLTELAHDAIALGRAVDEALRHQMTVAGQFRGLAEQSHFHSPSEVRLSLAQDDMVATVDPLDQTIVTVRERASTVDPERGEALVLRQALSQLTNARAPHGIIPGPFR